MHCTIKISEDLFWVGGNDRRLALFENIFPIPRGVSYNSYVLLDQKTVLLDTTDYSISRQFMENLRHTLGERGLDYLIINHMEPDHAALISDISAIYPNVKLVVNAKTLQILKQFFPEQDFEKNCLVVKEGDVLDTGRHKLSFIMAPMVHWPEVMMTYDSADKTLFSADAFGTFGALNGNIFNDEINFDRDWLDDCRRYYANIVGKFGAQVQAVLRKAAELEIKTICPLHGPIWRSDIAYLLEKYGKWSSYTPEDNGVVIIYGSMYGNTESAANALAGKLSEAGVRNIAVYDVSSVHVSQLISEIFRCKCIVIASPTYNGGIYPPMLNLLHDMKALGVQGRSAAIIENCSWGAVGSKKISELLSEMKNMKVITEPLVIKSTLQISQESLLNDITAKITEELI